MATQRRIKNIFTKEGLKYYRRWVVLGVEVHIIDLIRKRADKDGTNIPRAFSDMIREASDEDK